MKFGQLAVGALFEFRGARYRKISPIEAINAESDQRKLIPRSAPVVAVDVAGNLVEDRILEAVHGADLESALTTCVNRLRQRVLQQLLADDAERIAVFDELLMQSQRELRADLLSRGAGNDRGRPTGFMNGNEGDITK